MQKRTEHELRDSLYFLFLIHTQLLGLPPFSTKDGYWPKVQGLITTVEDFNEYLNAEWWFVSSIKEDRRKYMVNKGNKKATFF